MCHWPKNKLFLQVTFITYFQPKTLAKLAASKQYKSIKQRRLLDKNASPLSLYISLFFHFQTLLPLDKGGSSANQYFRANTFSGIGKSRV